MFVGSPRYFVGFFGTNCPRYATIRPSKYAQTAELTVFMANPNDVIPRAQAAGNGPALRYPADIEGAPYHTLLRFQQFRRSEPTERPQEFPMGSIVLPLPAELIENYNITYGQPALGTMGLAIKDLGDAPAGDVQASYEAIKARSQDPKFATDAIVNTTQQVLGALSQSMEAAVALVAGNALNPHMRAVFESIPLRLFSFTWKIAPRTPDEGRAIRQIVNKIRYHSLPSDNLGGLRLSFPDELYIDFIGKHADFLPKIRKCVVVSVQFNHARNGTPTFFHDGTPTHMELALQIQEVNQITRESF